MVQDVSETLAYLVRVANGLLFSNSLKGRPVRGLVGNVTFHLWHSVFGLTFSSECRDIEATAVEASVHRIAERADKHSLDW